MNFNQTFFDVIEEQNILKTTKTKPIVDAIKNRNKISFFYSGPRKPEKTSVKPGNRIDAEAVALGLNKKGNLVVRAYVQPPSVSKKGFDKTGWRTFMVGRMSNLKVSDSKFNQKRPDYKEGDDKSMSVTYVTADWTNKPEVKKPRIVKPTVTKQTPKPVQPQPTEPQPVEPEVKPTEPTPTELPQPTQQTKPTKTPPRRLISKMSSCSVLKQYNIDNQSKSVQFYFLTICIFVKNDDQSSCGEVPNSTYSPLVTNV